MRSSYQVTTGPASEPVTVAEAKSHLKVDFDTDDTLLATLIQAAREEAEAYTNRYLMPQTVKEKFDRFDGEYLQLSASPFRGVTAITYKDENGDSQTLSSSNYVAYEYQNPTMIGKAYGQTWPSTRNEPQAVTVEYTVGYDDAASVPAAIKSAILLIVGHLYENRTDTVRKMPTQAEYLLWKYRVIH